MTAADWVVLGLIVLLAALVLVKLLKPSKKGCCGGCAGCAGCCPAPSDQPDPDSLTFIGKGAQTAERFAGEAALYGKCPDCGYYMRIDPKKDDRCPCGALYEDASIGRFGCLKGEGAVEIYCLKK